jgi:hypothetical protein
MTIQTWSMNDWLRPTWNNCSLFCWIYCWKVKKIPYYLISSYWLLISVYSWLCGPGQWLINLGRWPQSIIISWIWYFSQNWFRWDSLYKQRFTCLLNLFNWYGGQYTMGRGLIYPWYIDLQYTVEKFKKFLII